MNTCKCGHVTYRAETQCMSCASKTAWKNGNYSGIREKLRTLRSGTGVERISTARRDRDDAGPRSTVDNALRDAFRKVIGFDPLYDSNPAWKFAKQINYGAAGG